ncbi:MAG TPA: MFS transporter [Gammaproteobacteria bacterium]|nr:MFS transporter [Gammaproteobacteria bacterium]
MQPGAPSVTRIPRAVWALGIVSLLMDVSSEMIHSLLPLFLTGVLGASVTTVGFLEGVAEATASITKVFSGTLSDRIGKRKLLAVLGYGLGALTKPLFALAPSTAWVFGARFADRVGKGIRGAPRDALIADVTPANLRGASFGLRQALDTVGAFLGPLLAIALMTLTHDRFRFVFWIAALPAFASVLLLLVSVDEPERARNANAKPLLLRAVLGTLGPQYWLVVAVATLFTLARFSEAFLILKAADVGFSAAAVPLVLVAMNAAYALSAYPAGKWSDRASRWTILALGSGLLIASDLVLAAAHSAAGALAGIALWGVHLGCTQGLFAALVADTAAPAQRGTAFGMFNLVTGVALLAASALAGVVWDRFGPGATFLTGAALAALSAAVALTRLRRK